MIKILLTVMAGLLLTGCTGQVLSSVMLVEAVSSTQSALSSSMAASPAQDEATESSIEEAASSDASALPSALLPGIQLFTFDADEPRWFSLDDNVMGGISNSNVVVAESGYLSFSGTMSLENNGGFASARSEWRTTDLSENDGILLRVLGDGNSYRLRIQSATSGREISYNALFDTTPDTWQLVYIPFADMVPTYFGYVMDVGPIDRAEIGSFGFMLSDNQPGEFALFVDWVRAVSEEELFALGS